MFCIWIPDRLQINDSYHRINFVWDRIEKCLFLVIDASLNLYFIWIVKSRLISHGLTKYNTLLRFNKTIIFVSVSLDVILIALMQLSNDFVYVQFQSLAYLIKLEIEMTTSQLIIQVATSTGVTVIEQTESTARGVMSSASAQKVQVEVRTQVLSDANEDDKQSRESISNKVEMDILSRAL